MRECRRCGAPLKPAQDLCSRCGSYTPLSSLSVHKPESSAHLMEVSQ